MTDIIVPSTQSDLDNINKVIKELSNSKTRQESEAEYQKEAIKELAEKYNIKAKYIKRMLNDYHKNSFNDNVEEMSAYEILFESVFKRKSQSN